ncbi:M48 family metallopeptidase [Desulfovibrio cuneatus]|uniref:M48 family metallopeptidase n=1 Tax=Desulfovibrio cuneatus TaxID=159728 RepID=UPI0003FC5944|nr:M48 family metallopeptidase [Desulfovibrio cuneatus]
MTVENIPEPMFSPPYTVRRSQRARRILLRIVPGKGLEVILPPHADPAQVPGVVVRMRSWIEKHMPRFASSCGGAGGYDVGRHEGGENGLHGGARGIGAGTHGAGLPLLPLALPLLGGKAPITVQRRTVFAGQGLRQQGVKSVGMEEAEGRVVLLPERVQPAQGESQRLTPEGLAWLRERLRREAEEMLLPRLEGYAVMHGFRYEAVRFRFQRTRWGSCSAKGNINLNVGLVFLPEPLIRYVLLHELCHTVALDHSERFWKALFAVEGEALILDKQLRRGQRYVPEWLY